ncbi:MAG: class I SAM-dependent methyltransferase [Elusimicrobia bacterium]|nr:class I SAM-dependent methyltransferase [Elusimicrobiota bacterium]
MVSRRRHWWRSHFDVETLAGYGLEAKTNGEVRGLIRLLDLKPGAEVLDLCCGAGRHAVLLAARGMRVTGVDIKPDLLAAARREAAARGVALELRRADMRRLPFRGRFDVVANLFTSFGYFLDEKDDARALRSARRALKPGGRLVLDLLNRDWLVRHFKPRFVQKERSGPLAKAVNRLAFDPMSGRLDNRRTLIGRDGRARETFLSFRVYALTEIRRLLDDAGLRLLSVRGGLNGSPYGMDSFRMVVVARKR